MCRLVPKTGRGAQRLDSHILYHEDSLLSSSSTNHTIEKLASTAAKPVKAHRAKIPAVAATVPPEKFLKGRRRFLFEHQDLLQQEHPLGDPPKPCHMISRDEEHLLRLRIFSSGAGAPMPFQDVPVVNGKPLVAGFFAVDHSEDWDRLILDRRPQNSREKRLGWLQLPLGCLFARVHLHCHQTIRGSGMILLAISPSSGSIVPDLLTRPWADRSMATSIRSCALTHVASTSCVCSRSAWGI